MNDNRTPRTAWGQRWIQDLQRLSTAWQNRLPRGRDYAAKGHVLSLSIAPGRITAKVQGSRSKPYTTTIDVPANKDTEWERLLRRLAREARYPAQLLTGDIPSDLEDRFREESLNLFPVRNSELIGHCTCPDKARPCKHIAAVHFAFGEALDRDPFLLLQLRGADRDAILRGFQRVWFGHNTGHERAEQRQREADSVRGVRIAPHSADRFNRAPNPIERMNFHVQQPDNTLLVLKRLSNPRPWELPIGTNDLFGPVYDEATRLALHIALEGIRELDDEDDDQTPFTFDDDDFDDSEEDDDEDEDFDDNDEDEDDDSEEEQTGSFVALPQGPAPSEASPPRPTDQRAAEQADRRPSPPETERRGDLLANMLGDAAPRPARQHAAQEPAPSSATANPEPSVLIRRGAGERRSRRKQKRGADPRPTGAVRLVTAPGEAHEGPTAEEATATALDALRSGHTAQARDAAREAWRRQPDIARLTLLLNTADDAVGEEAATVRRFAAVRPLQLTGAQLMLLMLDADTRTPLEAMRERVDKGLPPGDEAPDLFARAALRMLLAGRQTPPTSALQALLMSLDAVPHELETLEEPASVGRWLDRIAFAHLDDQARDALADGTCDAVLGLLETGGRRADKEGADQLAALAAATAEGLGLADDHRRLSLFLHRSHTAAAGRAGITMREILGHSPILPAGLIVDTD